VTYPETVDLARILAIPHWCNPAGAVADELQRFKREIRSYSSPGYRTGSSC
jgi:hypothetical protein